MTDRKKPLFPLTSDGKGLYMGELRMGSLFTRKPLYPKKKEK